MLIESSKKRILHAVLNVCLFIVKPLQIEGKIKFYVLHEMWPMIPLASVILRGKEEFGSTFP